MHPQSENLLARQWRGYQQFHRSRRNLVIHIVAVPAFLAGNILVVVSAARLEWLGIAIGIVLTVASLMAQGRGHRSEARPPEPFTSPMNAMLRLMAEQWIAFPRFVFSGKWRAAMRRA